MWLVCVRLRDGTGTALPRRPVPHHIGHGPYTVDVRKMTQRRGDTGQVRRVRRLGGCYGAWRDDRGLWLLYDT